jgi:hypothetical protein
MARKRELIKGERKTIKERRELNARRAESAELPKNQEEQHVKVREKHTRRTRSSRGPRRKTLATRRDKEWDARDASFPT